MGVANAFSFQPNFPEKWEQQQVSELVSLPPGC
jgi:hypothetical protein